MNIYRSLVEIIKTVSLDAEILPLFDVECIISQVFTRNNKDSLDIVEDILMMSQVSSLFGHFVKYIVCEAEKVGFIV